MIPIGTDMGLMQVNGFLSFNMFVPYVKQLLETTYLSGLRNEKLAETMTNINKFSVRAMSKVFSTFVCKRCPCGNGRGRANRITVDQFVQQNGAEQYLTKKKN